MIVFLALVVAAIAAIVWLVRRHLEASTGSPRHEAIGPELQLPPPRSVRRTRSATIGLVAVAAVVVIVTGVTVRDRYREADELTQLRAYGASSAGFMTRRYTIVRRYRRTYHVRYAYKVNARLYFGNIESRSLYERFQEAGRIPIVYLPETPAVSRVGHRSAIPAALPTRIRRNGWSLAGLWCCAGIFGVWRLWTHQERRKVLASHGVPIVATVVKSGGLPRRVDLRFDGPLGPQRQSIRCSLAFSARTPAGSQVVLLVNPTNAFEGQLYEYVSSSIVLDEPTAHFGRVVSGPSAL